jgi:flagellar export protein FliJ
MSTRPRFAAVVTLHETQEREARRRLGELERRRQELTDRIGSLLAERHNAAATVHLTARDQLTRYWIHIEAQVRQLQDGFGRLDQEINAVRTLLAEAHRNLAIFRKLQERDAVEQARRAERQAAKRMEEFAARRFQERQMVTPTVSSQRPLTRSEETRR